MTVPGEGLSFSTGCRWSEQGMCKAQHPPPIPPSQTMFRGYLLICVPRWSPHPLLTSSVPPDGKLVQQDKEGVGKASLDFSKFQGLDQIASGDRARTLPVLVGQRPILPWPGTLGALLPAHLPPTHHGPGGLPAGRRSQPGRVHLSTLAQALPPALLAPPDTCAQPLLSRPQSCHPHFNP